MKALKELEEMQTNLHDKLKVLTKEIREAKEAGSWAPTSGPYNSLSMTHDAGFDTFHAAKKASRYQLFLLRYYKLAQELNESWNPGKQEERWVISGDFDEQFFTYQTICAHSVLPSFKSEEIATKALRILVQERQHYIDNTGAYE